MTLLLHCCSVEKPTKNIVVKSLSQITRTPFVFFAVNLAPCVAALEDLLWGLVGSPGWATCSPGNDPHQQDQHREPKQPPERHPKPHPSRVKPVSWPHSSPPAPLVGSYSFVYSHDFSNSTLLRCQRQLGGRRVTAGVGSA